MSAHSRIVIPLLLRSIALAMGVLTMATPPPLLAAELDRLFFTPQQRLEMEARRTTRAPPPVEPAPPTPQVQETLITVNGRVVRSSGKTTTWINGVPQYNVMRSADPARMSVESAAGRKSVKIGQTLDTTRGDVRDPLGGGEIHVYRKPAR